MNAKFEKILNHKIFRKGLWEGISVGLASLLVLTTGGYHIAMSQSAAINHALNISGSDIVRSDDERYQYFKSDYSANEYDKLQRDFLKTCGEVEAEGLVLLRNKNNALPLTDAESKKVSTFLTGSVSFNYATSGSSGADTAGYTNLKTALEGAGLKVNGELWDFYNEKTEEGYGRYKQGTLYVINEVPYDEYGDILGTVDEYSTAIVTIARDSGEGADLTASSKVTDGLDGSCLSLTQDETDVLEGLTALKKQGKVKKIIVLLNSSATIRGQKRYKSGCKGANGRGRSVG